MFILDYGLCCLLHGRNTVFFFITIYKNVMFFFFNLYLWDHTWRDINDIIPFLKFFLLYCMSNWFPTSDLIALHTRINLSLVLFVNFTAWLFRLKASSDQAFCILSCCISSLSIALHCQTRKNATAKKGFKLQYAHSH